MAQPEESTLSSTDQFFIATFAGDRIAEIVLNSRVKGERKKNSDDSRLPYHIASIKRDSIVEFVGNLEPSLGCLAIEWALDEKLRQQIIGDVEPIKFHKAEPDYSTRAYAGMLALAATVTKRRTEGRYNRVALYAQPRDSAEKVALRYRMARATRSKRSV